MHRVRIACPLLLLLVPLLAEAQAEPSRSASPRTIVFQRFSQSVLESDIYSVNEDGTNLTRLSHDGQSRKPSWSADGRHILFVRHAMVPGTKRKSPWELWVMNRDGSEARLLIRREYAILGAAWSPNGKAIAINCAADESLSGQPSSTSEEAQVAICLMDAEGTAKPKLLARNGWMPSWSPDGQRIAFSVRLPYTRYGLDEGIRWSIHIIRVDGSDETQLTDPSRNAGSPAWSPDGKQIAFDASTKATHQVFVADANGLHERQLTKESNWDCQNPSWSPDGKQLAVWCMSNPACAPVAKRGVTSPCLRRIFVISTTDPEPKLRQVTDENGAFPQFAPDSE